MKATESIEEVTMLTRRQLVLQASAAVVTMRSMRGFAMQQSADAPNRRPPLSERRFQSKSVERFLRETAAVIRDPVLAAMFTNCFPNTLDTTVEPGVYDGKPDTVVITGDIAAMWLRDSSAQVWPYLRFTREDAALRDLLEGVIRRQTRCLLIDPYANAFMADLNAPPLEWSRSDKTEMKRGVGERKYELDSLCYPIRLAHGFWKMSGSTSPFDAHWAQAMRLIVSTMRVQQRKQGPGPYRFQRLAETSTDTLSNHGMGNPVRPVGLIASAFRPSDDACVFPFLIPSNLFAVRSLTQLAEMASAILNDSDLANDAHALATEVQNALHPYGVAQTAQGSIWAYEVDGFGSQLLMDDANAPSLLALPYLECSPDASLYARTRAFVWSERNPWFFQGSAGEGVGGPHEGANMIWPMSQTIYALTSHDDAEIKRMLSMLVTGSNGSGFIHESYNRNNAADFTRSWFAWANTIFGELIANLAASKPAF